MFHTVLLILSLVTSGDIVKISLLSFDSKKPKSYSLFEASFKGKYGSTSSISNATLPKKGSGSTAHSGDNRNIKINPDGTIREVQAAAIDRSVLSISISLRQSVHESSLVRLSSVLESIVSQAPRLKISRESYEFMRADFTFYSLIAADVRGDELECQRWLRLVGGDVSGLLPLYLAKAGNRSPELMANLREGVSRLYVDVPGFFGGTLPKIESDPIFFGEITAAHRSSWSPWLQEIHARRALKWKPNQAASAMILMPILTRTKRSTEAIKLGEAALKIATEETRKLISLPLNDAKNIQRIEAALKKKG
jgi:hypothetical protein